MRTQSEPAQPKQRVLLVDDEAEVTQGVIRALADLPYEFLTASSGQSALALLERREVDVIVADERMPGMGGSELLAHVRRKYPRVVRIMLTGHASVTSAMEAIYDGWVFQYLQKPCSTEILATTIQNALLLQEFVLPNDRIGMSTDEQQALLLKLSVSRSERPQNS